MQPYATATLSLKYLWDVSRQRPKAAPRMCTGRAEWRRSRSLVAAAIPFLRGILQKFFLFVRVKRFTKRHGQLRHGPGGGQRCIRRTRTGTGKQRSQRLPAGSPRRKIPQISGVCESWGHSREIPQHLVFVNPGGILAKPGPESFAGIESVPGLRAMGLDAEALGCLALG